MPIELTDEGEPSNMLPDKKRTIEEDEVPKEQDGPLSKEMFLAQFRQLTGRARAAGLHPIKMLVKAYAKRGEAIIESLLGALENEDGSKKKKE